MQEVLEYSHVPCLLSCMRGDIVMVQKRLLPGKNEFDSMVPKVRFLKRFFGVESASSGGKKLSNAKRQLAP
ncbi:hypothetical protein R1sor_000776 [Riccia sorocarpa]|uniref:Uncharacterized protein n=1 Tax=Riccia sorocarpa TaxID=122646 RepID=A0ABD3GWL4_9MARC